jgi:hypothetical protein
MPDLLITITQFGGVMPAWPAMHGGTAPVVGGVLSVSGTLTCSTTPNPTGQVWLRIDGANTTLKSVSTPNWTRSFNIDPGDRTKRIGVFARATAGNETAGHALAVTLFVPTFAVSKRSRKKKGKKGSKKRSEAESE